MDLLAIEEVMSSKGRVKVLKTLMDNVELNISEVVRRSGLNYTAVDAHIEALKKAGLIEEKTFGRIRILRVKLGIREFKL